MNSSKHKSSSRKRHRSLRYSKDEEIAPHSLQSQAKARRPAKMSKHSHKSYRTKHKRRGRYSEERMHGYNTSVNKSARSEYKDEVSRIARPLTDSYQKSDGVEMLKFDFPVKDGLQLKDEDCNETDYDYKRNRERTFRDYERTETKPAALIDKPIICDESIMYYIKDIKDETSKIYNEKLPDQQSSCDVSDNYFESGNNEDQEESVNTDDNFLENSRCLSNDTFTCDNSPKMDSEDDLPAYYPAIEGCRSVNEYQLLNHVEEGTYGVVYRAVNKQTHEMVALKLLKMEHGKEGFPIVALREINTLLKGQHKNVVTIREIVIGNCMNKVYIVMDYLEHDLKSLMGNMKKRGKTFCVSKVKCLVTQLLSAVDYLHDNWIIHRDLKPSNILLSASGILKVGDFGLAREYGSPLKPYTPVVVTLWYRAPELLLGTKKYSTPIDMWSLGCIFGELLLMHPIFQGKSEIEQIGKIFKCLGTPDESIWPDYNKLPAVMQMKLPVYPSSNLKSRFRLLSMMGYDLLQRLLTYDPQQRVSAREALKHPYFTETPVALDPSLLLTRKMGLLEQVKLKSDNQVVDDFILKF